MFTCDKLKWMHIHFTLSFEETLVAYVLSDLMNNWIVSQHCVTEFHWILLFSKNSVKFKTIRIFSKNSVKFKAHFSNFSSLALAWSSRNSPLVLVILTFSNSHTQCRTCGVYFRYPNAQHLYPFLISLHWSVLALFIVK